MGTEGKVYLTGRRKRFLELATSVGEFVISRAETVEDGVRWETIGYGGEPEYSTHVYSGVSGIVIFLADLCRITKDGRVREMAEAGGRWVDRTARARAGGGVGKYPGLFAGFAGHGLAFLKLAEATGAQFWMRQAVERAEAIKADDLSTPDLILGAPGTGIFLLRMYRATDDAKFLQRAVRLGENLVGGAMRGEGGIYWLNDAGEGVRKSIGPAHGVAGVGLFLADLLRLTGRDDFRETVLGSAAWIRGRAMATEFGIGWPRFEGDAESPRVQWCHGSPGVGLFLVRAFEETGEAWIGELATTAAEATYRAGDVRGNPSQCHGLAGNGELLLEMARVFDGREWAVRAVEFGRLAAGYRESVDGVVRWPSDEPGDYSLDYMMGASGTGHFFLRLAEPEEVRMVIEG